MSEHEARFKANIEMENTSTDQIPPRPEGWSLADEGYEKVERIDYYGKPYTAWVRKGNKIDLGNAWASFREQFNSQQQDPLIGHNNYTPPLDLIDYKNSNPEK